MGLPKTIRLKDEVEQKVETYMEINGVRFSDLINNALDKYISEPQTIVLQPVDSKKFLEKAKGALKKHKHAMDKLK